jgi:hypothetical protein
MPELLRHWRFSFQRYRLLKAHDLITGPAYIVMETADGFKDMTTAPNQL